MKTVFLQLKSRCLAVMLAFFAGPLWAADLPVPEAYLPELKTLLETGVRLSPRMLDRNAEQAMAAGNLLQARAGQLPSVGANLQYNPAQRDYRSDLAKPVFTQKFYYNLTLTQPVYHWGALQNNTRIGELQVRIAEGATAEAYRLLVLEIRAQYLRLVALKAQVRRAQFLQERAEADWKLAQDRYEQKVIASAERFIPEINLEQARLGLDRVAAAYDDGKVALARLLGVEKIRDEQVADGLPQLGAASADFAALLERFLAQPEPRNYHLQTMLGQITIEELNWQNHAVRLRPKVNLLVGTNRDELSYTSNIAARYGVVSVFAGVQVNWPIFDGFARKGAMASSLARKRQLEQNYRDAERTLSERARTELRQVELSRRNMEIFDRLLAASEGGLTAQKENLSRGTASASDVAGAQIGFNNAEATAFDARIDYWMRVSEFLSTLLQDPALARLPKRDS